MRKDISPRLKVRTGDTVRIFLKLPRGHTHARLTVWAQRGNGDMCPYCDQLDDIVTVQGKPTMLKPYYVALSDQRKRHTFEIKVTSDMTFLVRQEVDMEDSPTIRARIRRYGNTYETFRRRCGDFLRRIWSRPDSRDSEVAER